MTEAAPDQDKTDPNLRERYAEAESRTDKLLLQIVNSSWSAAICGSTAILLLLIGIWLGHHI